MSLKRPKIPLNFSFLSHPFCDYTTLPLIPIFYLSSIFSLCSPSVLHSLSSIFFPFLCAPVFIKPNWWVSVWRDDGMGLGLEELRCGSRSGGATAWGVAAWVSVWRGNDWLSRPWASQSWPGLKILVLVLFAWASRS